ncbi:hypothetical protein [Kribbella sp. NPDC004536]|uniref:hypothetical protein n=1 Tax=Kribbella sp. NPDC004536 TaxID=3364106 RepID=UPI003674A6F7
MYAKRPGMTDGCRVLLLRLLDDMGPDGIVSIPRSKLAAELGVAPPRISERVKLARALGFLDIVRRARPKVTAVYQATIPSPARGTESVPQTWNDGYLSEVRPAVPVTGTESVPLSTVSEVRMYPTQVVGTLAAEPGTSPRGEKRSDKGDIDNYVYDDDAWLNGTR